MGYEFPAEVASVGKRDVGEKAAVTIPRRLCRVPDQPDALAFSKLPCSFLRLGPVALRRLRRVNPDQSDSLTTSADEPNVERIAVHDVGDRAAQGKATGLGTRRRCGSDQCDCDAGSEAKPAYRQRLQ